MTKFAGLTLDELIEAYPGLGYAVAKTETHTDRARRLYSKRYGHNPMQTKVVRQELSDLLKLQRQEMARLFNQKEEP